MKHYHHNVNVFHRIACEYGGTIAPVTDEQLSTAIVLSDMNNPDVQRFFTTFHETHHALPEPPQHLLNTIRFLWYYNEDKQYELDKKIKNLNTAWKKIVEEPKILEEPKSSRKNSRKLIK